MSNEAEVVVIGAGVGGLAAALGARDAGAEVQVLHAGAGASALAGGAWDVAADVHGGPLEALEPSLTVTAHVERVARERPAHPYAQLGDTPMPPIRRVHERVLPALGYRPLAEGDPGALFVTDLGVVKRAASGQHELLDLAALPRATVGIPTVPAYPGYDARFLCPSLQDIALHTGDTRRYELLDVDLFTAETQRGCQAPEVAAIADTEEGRARIVAALAPAIRDAACDAVLLPPVLGLDDRGARDAVERELGVPVGEVVAPLAGPQGLRLDARIHATLEAEGCTVRHAVVTRVVPQGQGMRVEWEGDEGVDARAVVLATGKHVGGGLVVERGRIREPLAGLPVWSDGQPPTLPSSPHGPDPAVQFGTDFVEGAPGWRQGIGYDATFRALALNRTPVSPGLHVAGALLDGVDPARDGTGLGCCALTGFLAGRHAAGWQGTQST